jgi:AcrR family transcriptional regulator
MSGPRRLLAARAGIGIATLYRRFPARQQLVAAALIEKISQYAEAAEQALAVPDPWAGFSGFVERICELQAGDRGLADLLSMTLPAGEHVERVRRLANDRVVELVERAKAAGQLREDFTGEDLLLLLIAHAAVVNVTRTDAPHAWRPFIALALDAFQRSGAPPCPRRLRQHRWPRLCYGWPGNEAAAGGHKRVIGDGAAWPTASKPIPVLEMPPAARRRQPNGG